MYVYVLYVQIFDDPPFIETIDFIFVSKTVEVLSCKRLKERCVCVCVCV